MASAGFYFVGTDDEPDLVRCYYCRRELDGWEPSDDPWAEHARRDCPFIKMAKKGHEKLTTEDMFKLEEERAKKLLVSSKAVRNREMLYIRKFGIWG